MNGHHDHGHDHDHHGHDHGHGHHHHHHGPARADLRWAVGVALNAGFVLVEGGYGVAGHSMALLADAGHNLSDVLALAMSGVAAWLARRSGGPQHTYGFGKATVLAALANAVLLVFACGAIADATVGRLLHPAAPATGVMMAVAAVGIVINGLTAVMFLAGRHEDINVRAAFMHMAADAGIAAGVVVAGGLILLTGFNWIDPAVSILILLTVLAGAWDLLKEAFSLAMDRAPTAVDVVAVRAFLETCPDVAEVHDLHVWPLSTTETALTAHLVRPHGADDEFLKKTAAELETRFRIRHATLQVEVQSLTACEALHA